MLPSRVDDCCERNFIPRLFGPVTRKPQSRLRIKIYLRPGKRNRRSAELAASERSVLHLELHTRGTKSKRRTILSFLKVYCRPILASSTGMPNCLPYFSSVDFAIRGSKQ